MNQYQRLFSTDFENLSRDDIKSTGYVVDSIEAAVWCALNNVSFKDAVLTAVNLGGDADTIASLTATIKACENPDRLIPSEWLNSLVNRTLLNQVIVPFSEKFATAD